MLQRFFIIPRTRIPSIADCMSGLDWIDAHDSISASPPKLTFDDVLSALDDSPPPKPAPPRQVEDLFASLDEHAFQSYSESKR